MTNEEFEQLFAACEANPGLPHLSRLSVLGVLNAAEEVPSVKAAFAVVEAAAALVKSGGDDGFESCEFATLHIALEVAVEAWRGAQTGAQG